VIHKFIMECILRDNRMKFTKIALFLFTLIRLVYSGNLSSGVEGKIYNVFGHPVADAQIRVTPGNIQGFTDSTGYFKIDRLPENQYTVKIIHISYHSRTVENISITDNEIFNLGIITLTGKIFSLQQTVVTATRSAEKVLNISNSVNIIDKITIENRNAKTSAEALREENGIFIQKTNHGGGSAILRGLSSNQILLMVDGIRLNNSTYRLGNHQYLTTVDHQMIDEIEVVRGPTSVQYGSDALGGTIQLLSKTPAFSEGNPEFHYQLTGRYATADEEKLTRAHFSVNAQKVAFQGGFSYKSFGDLRRGRNSHFPELENSTDGIIQSPSGYAGFDADGKLVYAITPARLLSFSYQMGRQNEVPRYDKYESGKNHTWLYDPQKRDLFYLKYQDQLNKKYLAAVNVILSYHRQQEGRITRKKITSDIEKDMDDVHTGGLVLQFNTYAASQLLTYGLDVYRDKVFSDRYLQSPLTGISVKQANGRYPDSAVYQSLGIFLQDEFQVSKKWLLTGGVRLNRYFSDFTFPELPVDQLSITENSVRFSALTGSAGLTYLVNPHLSFSGNVAHAFRAPNLSDMAKLDESKGDVYEIPNFNLEPEKLFNYELGIKAGFNRFSGGLSLYHSTIQNLIASAPVQLNGSDSVLINDAMYQVKSKQNIGSAYIRGCEIFLEYILNPEFTLISNYTYTYGQNTSRDEPVGGIPPAFGLAGIRYNHREYALYFYSRFADRQERLSADDLDDPRIPNSGTPAWFTLNFRARYQWNQYVTIRAAVENIMDYNYREHGSGINGPGRNIIVGLTFGQ